MIENTDPLDVNSIQISVKSAFLPAQSATANERFVFSYTITITNHSARQIKLLSRHWLITDANGHTITVQGDGVVGQQPTIAPAQSFTYTSGAILETPVGSMQGHYQMIADKALFQVTIPPFSLALPNILN